MDRVPDYVVFALWLFVLRTKHGFGVSCPPSKSPFPKALFQKPLKMPSVKKPSKTKSPLLQRAFCRGLLEEGFWQIAFGTEGFWKRAFFGGLLDWGTEGIFLGGLLDLEGFWFEGFWKRAYFWRATGTTPKNKVCSQKTIVIYLLFCTLQIKFAH